MARLTCGKWSVRCTQESQTGLTSLAWQATWAEVSSGWRKAIGQSALAPWLQKMSDMNQTWGATTYNLYLHHHTHHSIFRSGLTDWKLHCGQKPETHPKPEVTEKEWLDDLIQSTMVSCLEKVKPTVKSKKYRRWNHSQEMLGLLEWTQQEYNHPR